jgi:hypothetical protein
MIKLAASVQVGDTVLNLHTDGEYVDPGEYLLNIKYPEDVVIEDVTEQESCYKGKRYFLCRVNRFSPQYNHACDTILVSQHRRQE